MVKFSVEFSKARCGGKKTCKDMKDMRTYKRYGKITRVCKSMWSGNDMIPIYTIQVCHDCMIIWQYVSVLNKHTCLCCKRSEPIYIQQYYLLVRPRNHQQDNTAEVNEIWMTARKEEWLGTWSEKELEWMLFNKQWNCSFGKCCQIYQWRGMCELLIRPHIWKEIYPLGVQQPKQTSPVEESVTDVRRYSGALSGVGPKTKEGWTRVNGLLHELIC